jgi:diguanylate cyclase (GGDEF)-like protein
MRILVAEDDAITRTLLKANLSKWGYEVITCVDGVEAWEALQKEDAPPLAILDWMMPGIDGVALCRRLRRRDKRSYVYVILLTAKSLRKDIVKGLEAGADDYVIKPFDPHELRVRVRAGSRIISLQEELVRALEHSEYQARHDALTGLLNRRSMLDLVNKELSRAQREGAAVGLIMCDVDHFKRINDRHGHLAGDAVLREVARRLEKGVRPYDLVGRYGGEEFLILCPRSDFSATHGIAERLRSAFHQTALLTSEGSFDVSLSFGVAVLEARDRFEIEPFLKRADDALYQAKRLGRNRVEPRSATTCIPGPDTSLLSVQSRPAAQELGEGSQSLQTGDAARGPDHQGLW